VIAIRRFLPLAVLGAVCSLVLCSASFAKPPGTAGGYTLVEHATLVQPGNQSATAAETTSTGDPFTWGAVDLPIPSRLKLAQLTSLSTDYKIVLGSCWGGSPRFEAWVTNGKGTWKIFFYIGAPPSWTGCPSGVYANTGNLATPGSTVDDSQLGGSPSDQYSTVQARFGKYGVTHVYADLDGGWHADQVVDFDNTQVNSGLTTYEG
jgi:hypothetical protein